MVDISISVVDLAGNKTILQKKIIRDNTPPIVKIFVDGNEVTQDLVYVSDNSIIRIYARDDLSYVHKIAYRIDNGEWKEKIINDKEGYVEIKASDL